jgi:hypothetical protein
MAWSCTVTAGRKHMDLAYSPEYESFRAEVRGFLERSKDKWP